MFGLIVKGFLFIGLLIGLAVFYLLYNPFWSGIAKAFDEGRDSVLLSEVTNFDWDGVCVFRPYSIHAGNKGEHVEKIIGVGLNGHRFPNLNDDGKWAFIFIAGGEVIGIEEKGRAYYLKGEYANTCISAANAHIVREDDYLVIKDAP